jgi:transcriptional regulator with XRE-family HTH domain
MEGISMSISEKIKQCRKQKNLTQKDLADELHLSRKTISGWENGRGYPDIKSITQLSDIFGISVDDLLRDDNLLEHYAEQDKRSLLANKIAQITYYLILTLTIVSYGTIFNLWYINNTIILLILVVLISILFSKYSNWESFKKHKKLLRSVLSSIFFLFLNTIIIPSNISFFKLIKVPDHAEKLGIITGMFLVTIILSICLTIILFLHPQNKK